MKVLLVNGSSHVRGNTDLALRECAAELEKYGIETEIFSIGSDPVRGCIGCRSCKKSGKCVFSDDVMPLLRDKMVEADGIIIGSPTYYGGPNGALCALLDRVFYSTSSRLKYKPAAAVAVCRRSGATATLDRLNKYFTICEMPVVSSQYWNIVHGAADGEAAQDGEGLQTMRVLAKNMAYVLRQLPRENWPGPDEERIWTSFVR